MSDAPGQGWQQQQQQQHDAYTAKERLLQTRCLPGAGSPAYESTRSSDVLSEGRRATRGPTTGGRTDSRLQQHDAYTSKEWISQTPCVPGAGSPAYESTRSSDVLSEGRRATRSPSAGRRTGRRRDAHTSSAIDKAGEPPGMDTPGTAMESPLQLGTGSVIGTASVPIQPHKPHTIFHRWSKLQRPLTAIFRRWS